VATLYNGTTVNTHNVGDTIPVADWNNAAAILNASNPAAKVWLTSVTAQSGASGTFGSTIGSGGFTVGFQRGGMTASTSAVITIPVAGVYLLSASWGSNAATTSGGSLVQCQVLVNGASVATGFGSASTSMYIGATATSLHLCAAGDLITFSYYNNASTVSFSAGEGGSSLSAMLISH